MIQRILFQTLRQRFHQSKAIVVLGPRQVGKTTLVKACLEDVDCLFINGDDPEVRSVLEGAGASKLKALLARYQWVFIDEAQRIPDIGLLAKILIDQFPEVQLLISGSSALELGQHTQEPLTGRKFEYLLLPISWEEFEDHVGVLEATVQLDERLVFGMYPDVIQRRSDAGEVLMQLTSSYLYKDILALTGIQKPVVLDKLLKALALQLGNEVSYNELAQILDIDKATVAKYIDLLEKAFVVFTLRSFSRNQRNEIKNNRKVYFYDNGIRNALIQNLNPLDLRTDKGALWENFLIGERIKMQHYHRRLAPVYFWRTLEKQKIDLIEERNGQLYAFEFKWNSRGKQKIPQTFLKTYSANAQTIDHQNFREFVRFEE
ncbi:AAA family ATPase [bacterium]|nr:AAA family ATPase [bacterium]